MFKIGEFARITKVSARTLRHYEELGLLQPQRSDDNDYRVYSAADLERMAQITGLRAMGFSLGRINYLLGGVSQREHLQLIAVQSAEIQRELALLNQKFDALNALLEEVAMYAPEVRSLPAQRVIAMQVVVQDYQHVAGPMHMMAKKLCDHLAAHRSAQRAGQEIAIWHGSYGDLESFALEWAIPISGSLPATEDIAVYDLPSTPEMGVVLHKGSYEDLGNAYAALSAWLESSGYERVGNLREVYVHFDSQQQNNLTEVQIPVRRKST